LDIDNPQQITTEATGQNNNEFNTEPINNDLNREQSNTEATRQDNNHFHIHKTHSNNTEATGEINTMKESQYTDLIELTGNNKLFHGLEVLTNFALNLKKINFRYF
jgi:hypothetical protein